MPRYLEPAKLAQLLRAKEPSQNLFDKLGLTEEKAHTLRKQWIAKIHGRCQTCNAESCECKPIRTGDNRDPVKLLKQLPEGAVLDTVECRSCYQPSPFTVRHALWRLSKKNDWDAYYKCQPCHETIKSVKAMRQRRKEALAKMPPTKNLSLRKKKRTTKRKVTKAKMKAVKNTDTKSGAKSMKVEGATPEKIDSKKLVLKKVPAPNPRASGKRGPRNGPLTHRPFEGLQFEAAE